MVTNGACPALWWLQPPIFALPTMLFQRMSETGATLPYNPLTFLSLSTNTLVPCRRKGSIQEYPILVEIEKKGWYGW
ncbi:hypothetical protein GQ457_16G010710 [Hibiscus cannabinus]